MLVPKGLMENF